MDTNFVNVISINNQNIYCQELKVKHLKTIYKCLIGDDPDSKIVFYNLNLIISAITSLQIEEIEKLDFISYFLLLFEIRCMSSGNIIFAELTDNQTKVEFNIIKFIDELNSILHTNNTSHDTINDIHISYCLPTINDIFIINKQPNIEYIYNFFIKKIKLQNQEINFKNLSIENKKIILNQLPAKITSIVVDRVLKIVETINKINLLNYNKAFKDITLPLNLDLRNLIVLLKLLFGDQLMTVYDNILILCKTYNLTPEYIENCTPGEYTLFIKKLNNQYKSKETSQQRDLNIPSQNNQFNEMNPYLSSDLPPITSEASII